MRPNDTLPSTWSSSSSSASSSPSSSSSSSSSSPSPLDGHRPPPRLPDEGGAASSSHSSPVDTYDVLVAGSGAAVLEPPACAEADYPHATPTFDALFVDGAAADDDDDDDGGGAYISDDDLDLSSVAAAAATAATADGHDGVSFAIPNYFDFAQLVLHQAADGSYIVVPGSTGAASADQEPGPDFAAMAEPNNAAPAPPITPELLGQLAAPLQNLPTITSAQVQMQMQMQEAEDQAFQGTHPTALTNPNPNTLNPGNFGLYDFLSHWGWQNRCLQGLSRERGRFPWLHQINQQLNSEPNEVRYQDLDGDKYDLQGISWTCTGVSRKDARERRLLTYNNFVSKLGSDKWSPHLPDVILPQTESYFRFRSMQVRRNVNLAHFQLRNILACPSRSRAFYAGRGVIYEINPITGAGKVAMCFKEDPAVQFSTLSAGHGVVVAGNFTGEYLVRKLDAEYEGEKLRPTEGVISTHSSNITNHVAVHMPRSASGPHASFASNDNHFRTLDITRNTFVGETVFPYPLNCSALSPDRRLRVMVGDSCSVLITAAENERSARGRPEILQELKGHRDHGFACDWSDDGYTVATGFQDKAVKIWDARKWTNSSGVATPMCTMRAEMASVRSLKFSPLGSGKRVLVAAEEADFVNIIDAQTFRAKQTIDIFGEIGGVSFANEGHDLYVLCCDNRRGGLLQLERCGQALEPYDGERREYGLRDTWGRGNSCDWPSHGRFAKREMLSQSRRRLRAAALRNLDSF